MRRSGLSGSRIGLNGLFVLMLLFLSGCTAALMAAGQGRSAEGLLTESSYGAADMLIQQSRSLISTETPLAIGMLTDLDSPNEQTNFGRMVTEQIASRFVQLGYNVTAAPGTGEPPPAIAGAQGYVQRQDSGKAGASVITGTYAVARDAILVNLRIVESASGKVVAAFDYPVPLTRDVRELAKTSAEKSSFWDF